MTLLSESELREKLLSLRRPDQTDLVYGKTLEVFTDDLIQLITKYGDTREREGRIDALKGVKSCFRGLQDAEEAAYIETNYIDYVLAELKEG